MNSGGILGTVTTAPPDELLIRRSLREGDLRGIAGLHRRVYVNEFDRNEEFIAAIERNLERAVATGWPEDSGAVWLVQRGAKLDGSLGLTHDEPGVGRVRWFALDPAVRGRRLGGELLAELVETARAAGMQRLELDTFSALTVAARIYRAAGFRLVWERERSDWGPPITYQGYELELR
jgi:ribosomal protein S18 acetylase RimI-like enzyme